MLSNDHVGCLLRVPSQGFGVLHSTSLPLPLYDQIPPRSWQTRAQNQSRLRLSILLRHTRDEIQIRAPRCHQLKNLSIRIKIRQAVLMDRRNSEVHPQGSPQYLNEPQATISTLDSCSTRTLIGPSSARIIKRSKRPRAACPTSAAHCDQSPSPLKAAPQ